MARRRFEVRRDAKGISTEYKRYKDSGFFEELAQKIGFNDVTTNHIELSLDDNGCPILPEGKK